MSPSLDLERRRLVLLGDKIPSTCGALLGEGPNTFMPSAEIIPWTDDTTILVSTVSSPVAPDVTVSADDDPKTLPTLLNQGRVLQHETHETDNGNNPTSYDASTSVALSAVSCASPVIQEDEPPEIDKLSEDTEFEVVFYNNSLLSEDKEIKVVSYNNILYDDSH